MIVRKLLVAVLMIGCVPVASSVASSGQNAPPSQAWSFNGPLGTYDRGALQRGFKIYREVCSSCHSMNLLYYRNLEGVGYTPDQVKNIAAEYSVIDGPDDEGEMFERTAMPSDRFKAPFANDSAAKYANGGALPPDLSLITKARANGPNYVYAILTGYEPAPHGEEIAEGQHWNKYFPGYKLSMAPPLSDGLVAYEDGTPETMDQYARDVVQFLTWAGDPYMESRKKTGFQVLMFLCVFAGIMYCVKRKIWADVH